MNELTSLHPPWQGLHGVQAHFYTRSGGLSPAPYDSFNVAEHVGDEPSAVQNNRDRLRQSLPDPIELQWLQQVHGTEVHRISKAGAVIRGDGLLTRQRQLGCCVLTADCLPVFLLGWAGDDSTPEVGLVHAGWRGLAAGILEALLTQWRSPLETTRAWLAPAIGPCHFEVGAEVQRAFAQTDPELSDFFKPAGKNHFLADLYGIARSKLGRRGIEVSGGDYCSYCDASRFFSYRRSGVTGRNLSLIYIQ